MCMQPWGNQLLCMSKTLPDYIKTPLRGKSEITSYVPQLLQTKLLKRGEEIMKLTTQLRAILCGMSLNILLAEIYVN